MKTLVAILLVGTCVSLPVIADDIEPSEYKTLSGYETDHDKYAFCAGIYYSLSLAEQDKGNKGVVEDRMSLKFMKKALVADAKANHEAPSIEAMKIVSGVYHGQDQLAMEALNSAENGCSKMQ